jgi:probable phosphoglycerate mutase
MRVFLARHGETAWNAEHRLQGRADTRLTARGYENAQAHVHLRAPVPLAAV